MNDIDVLLLPGGSKYTAKWAMDFKQILDREFKYVYPVRYDNWDDRDDKFEIHKEDDDVERERRKTGNYGVIAYKEGCAVALKNIYEKNISPKFVVFIGFPYEWAKKERIDDEIRSWLYSVKVPALFIQQDKDAEINREKLRELVDDSVEHFQIETLWHDNDGEYDDLYELTQMIREFLN